MEDELLAHRSDCALHNEPASPNAECDCTPVEVSPAEQILRDENSRLRAALAHAQGITTRSTPPSGWRNDVLEEAATLVLATAKELKCGPDMKRYDPEDRAEIRSEERGYDIVASTAANKLRKLKSLPPEQEGLS